MVNVTKIDMFGWDTAFAIPYDQANAAIKKAKSTPKSFDYTSTGGLVHIQGEWDDWQIVEGGDGQNLNLKCPVKSGTISSGDETGDLSGGWLTIQIKLQDIPDPAARFDDPTGEKDGTPTAIKPKTSGTETDPAVVTISYNFPKVKGLLGLALPSVFAAYLSANLGLFNHTFSVLLVDERAAKGNFQWLKPTDVSYACADASDHSPEKSVFAVLAMTQNNPVGGNQHAIDNRILQTLPTGTNSAFAISPRQVLKHIFAPGATYVIQGSNMQDFHITNDDMTIKNHDGINWGHFKLQDGKKVKPHIKAGNFQMSLEANQVSLQIIDAHFDWSPGIEVLMTLNQFFQFDTKKNSKGLYVFLPKPGNTVRSVTASVHTSRVLNIVDIAVGIAGSLAGGLLGGFAGAWFDASGSVATSSATDAVITITEEEVAEGFDSLRVRFNMPHYAERAC
jgi:hypothetical protein